MSEDLVANAPINNVLAPLLDKLPVDQRNAALRDIAAGLSREEDLVVAAWILAAEAEQPDEVLEVSLRNFLIRKPVQRIFFSIFIRWMIWHSRSKKSPRTGRGESSRERRIA